MRPATLLCVVMGSILGGLSIAHPVFAHHSFGLFDRSQVISRTGPVNEFEWINPHTWLHVDLADENGDVTTWSFEAGNIAQLTRLGWNVESFSVGTQVTVGFRPMKDGSRGGQLMNVTLPDGRQVCSNVGCG